MSSQAVAKRAVSDKEVELFLACGALLFGVLYLDLQVPLGIAMPMLYNAVILFSLKSSNRTFLFVVAIAASVLCIGMLFYKPPVDQMTNATVNRLLAVFSFWVIFYLGLQKRQLEEKRAGVLREREKALEEVQVLRGFLPICANCKRIRDFQGSWTLLEKYISEHSEAEFSHGLCPECTKSLFPHLPQKQEAE